MDKKIYSVADISKICKVKENTVRVWIRDGQLIACKDDESRRYYVSAKEFQKFLEFNTKYLYRARIYKDIKKNYISVEWIHTWLEKKQETQEVSVSGVCDIMNMLYDWEVGNARQSQNQIHSW